MPKKTVISIILALAMLFASFSAYADDDENNEDTEISITSIQLQPDSTTATINGEENTLDAAPFISAENRTVAPLRFIAEALGAEVIWDPVGRAVLYQIDEEETITLTINSTTATRNGEEIQLPTAPVIHRASGRSLVPLRFFSETLGYTVNWEAETRTITITNEPQTEPEEAPADEPDESEEPETVEEEPEGEEPEPEPEPEPEEPEASDPAPEQDLADPSTLIRLELSGDESISLPNGFAITREYDITGYNEEGEEVDLTDVPLEWSFMVVLGFNEEWNPDNVGVTLTQDGTLTLQDVHEDIRASTWIYLLATTPEDYEHGYFEADLVVTVI